MCSICLQNPCHPRCPNAPDPVPVCICDECNDDIYEGEDVWHTPRGTYCKRCIGDFHTFAEVEE